MKKFLLAVAAVVFLTASGADRLAVAEPAARGGLTKEDAAMVWSLLESSIHSKEYRLISRAALNQMMTEIGLTDSSQLVSLNSAQKAKLGRVEGVKFLLVSEIGRFGKGISCTMRLLDASTGEIDPQRSATVRVNTLDELADRLEPVVNALLTGRKMAGTLAILTPEVRPGAASPVLVGDLLMILENELVNRRFQVQNLHRVQGILKKNHLADLNALEPKEYCRVGQLLEVQTLLLPVITRLDAVAIPYAVEESGARGIRFVGNFEGSIRIIDTATGRVTGSVAWTEKFNFRRLSRTVTKDWTPEDYGKYLIRKVAAEKIVPELLRTPALGGQGTR